jgi:hypothetical protein
MGARIEGRVMLQCIDVAGGCTGQQVPAMTVCAAVCPMTNALKTILRPNIGRATAGPRCVPPRRAIYPNRLTL